MPISAEALVPRGVQVLHPQSTYIADEVDLDRIAAGSVIHPGCRLSGEGLSIGPNCVLGAEGPVTLQDAQLGAGVHIKSGFVDRVVCWDQVEIGSAVHIRPGTLMEEGSACAHAVGFKQTILFPWVIAGSLINFCDALMAGGTSRKNHSEIGSSFIHFNFTPYGDKATASLIGDVPRGVMLDQAPIFLGGQGGIVGPVRMEYGTVLAAGSINRNDVPDPSKLVIPKPPPAGEHAFDPKGRRDVRQRYQDNIHYIAQLKALQVWYQQVRAVWATASHHEACLQGGLCVLEGAVIERCKRVQTLVEKVHDGDDLKAAWEQRQQTWNTLSVEAIGAEARDAFLKDFAQGAEGYTDRIQQLPVAAKASGTAWLQAIVDAYLT